ncbi:hypothetical protein RCL_jg23982.t1 [Rhizophagus clarus]|uniref:Endonuclease/exonuclease/phosphatase domain-containing protein n=1 Tax=Rhizophagus clarus TaxID=94130 RepID=A0A8H3LMA8_9GLOM|nr:hypothetical protein RCL_jg23982.t1 [Rhizophagus clarus]
MIEGAIQNFLGFATSSITEQQFFLLEDNKEYFLTDNEEEEADVKNIIIMRDFNTKWNEYEFLDMSHWRHDIFNYFKKHFIKETTSVFCDDISDMYTYIPNNPNHSHNKIDYIWCNIDLMLSTMDSKPQDVQPKCQPPSKTIYCYDEMQKIDREWNWDKFNKDISEYLDDLNIKLTVNKIREKEKVKQNHHPLYDSDLKRDLNMLKGMLNKIC